MQTCTHPHCPGHLGKFASCLDEALYEITLDGTYPSTGDVEYDGHFTLVTLDTSTDVLLAEGGSDERTVTVPPGTYLVQQDNAGFIDVTRFDLAGEAERVLHHYEARYATWLED